MLFFSMLVVYSAIVLTSVSTEYFDLPTAQVFEYYLYIWGAGDFIEELISCFVRFFIVNVSDEKKNACQLK